MGALPRLHRSSPSVDHRQHGPGLRHLHLRPHPQAELENWRVARPERYALQQVRGLPVGKQHHQIGTRRNALLAEFSQGITNQRVTPRMRCRLYGRVGDKANHCVGDRSSCSVHSPARQPGRTLTERNRTYDQTVTDQCRSRTKRGREEAFHELIFRRVRLPGNPANGVAASTSVWLSACNTPAALRPKKKGNLF